MCSGAERDAAGVAHKRPLTPHKAARGREQDQNTNGTRVKSGWIWNILTVEPNELTLSCVVGEKKGLPGRTPRIWASVLRAKELHFLSSCLYLAYGLATFSGICMPLPS